MYWPNLEYREEGSPQGRVDSRPSHTPVLCTEVLSFLACGRDRNYLDLTVGGGGHGRAILESTAPQGQLLGADRDGKALVYAQERLASYASRVHLVHAALRQTHETLRTCPFQGIHGALIDAGISSLQLGDRARGFSFSQEGPLDMRMDQNQRRTAQDFLEKATEEEIRQAIFEYGEDRHSRRIARAIVAARERGDLSSTTDLARVVARAVPRSLRRASIDAATRTFQAIRIVINNELEELSLGLSALVRELPQDARIVVISFHSLEDRIVKNQFRDAQKAGSGQVLTPKPLRASSSEIQDNPRARSARLRAFRIERSPS